VHGHLGSKEPEVIVSSIYDISEWSLWNYYQYNTLFSS